ncbi:MAG: hypothetical protein KJZ69_09515 [Phycisphaerales bacterium]|nr:hypothetical protein [Phycisphaerales bacterium]
MSPEAKKRVLREVKKSMDADKRVRAEAARHSSAGQSPSTSPSLAPEPEFLRDLKLDPDRPMLDQLEEFILGLDEEEYAQAFAWLEQNIYNNPQAMSVLTPYIVA